MSVHDLLRRAKAASRKLRSLDSEARNRGLHEIAKALKAHQAEILRANEADLAQNTELGEALKDRLRLTPERFDAMVRGVLEVAAQPDPLGAKRDLGQGRSGIRVSKTRIPLGVIAIVYEARPNVTADCAALCVKSGNAVVLRGGKEAIQSNMAIAKAVREGLAAADLPSDAAILIESLDHEAVQSLLGATGLVDLVIPRGGEKLMQLVDALARVPVIRHGQGICQVFVDASADIAMAANIAENAKVQRPAVCNAMETLLVHEAALAPLMAELGPRLAAQNIALRADPPAKAALLQAGVEAQDAVEADWDTEFHDRILAIRTVHSLDEALDHIEAHGTHHTASIVTASEPAAARFLREVDASCVLHNASTRFNDGGELGLGAEMGISTSKMHAYGPMSATELTAEKIVVHGEGQVRG